MAVCRRANEPVIKTEDWLCHSAPLLQASRENWPIGVLDPENNLDTFKKIR